MQRGSNSGMGQGGGRGRKGGNKPGAGPGGNCVCPNCGTKIEHRAGVPCYKEKCPECGTEMMRK